MKVNSKSLISTMQTVVLAVLLFSISACSLDGWRVVNTPGGGSFEMPEPVATPKREGYNLYESKFDRGKVLMQVGVVPRDRLDAEPGMSDADILNAYEKNWISQIQANLEKEGRPTDLEFEGDLSVDNGLGQQIRITAGDQFITTLFYLTPRALYFAKIDNADANHPAVKRFMETIDP